MLGAGDTGLASGLFFRPKENAGDFGLFDSRIFASGGKHYKCFTLKIDFNTSKQSGKGDCCRTWTTELCRNGSPPLLMSKVVCIARHLDRFITLFIFLTPPSRCVTLSRHTYHVSRLSRTMYSCCDRVTTDLWTVSAFNSCGLSGLVIDKTLSYFYA